jgi:hypothetical protein
VRQNLELIAALVCVVLLTGAYLLVADGDPPRPSGLLGHGIGIAGFALMLATETLYSWRKTLRRARWGRTRTWLSAHVFTGIVGPYMVFLHTGFRFAGLAGIAFGMTVIVVCSGFVGRYIYTAIPRTPAGDEMQATQLEAAIDQVERQLQAWLSAHGSAFKGLVEQVEGLPVASSAGINALFWRGRADRRYRRVWQGAVAQLPEAQRDRAPELAALLRSRRALRRQVAALASGRRLMASWHAMHVPLAAALFLSAFVHAVAALYFS